MTGINVKTILKNSLQNLNTEYLLLYNKKLVHIDNLYDEDCITSAIPVWKEKDGKFYILPQEYNWTIKGNSIIYTPDIESKKLNNITVVVEPLNYDIESKKIIYVWSLYAEVKGLIDRYNSPRKAFTKAVEIIKELQE